MTTHWLMACFPSDDSVNWGRYALLSFDEKWLRKFWKLTNAYKAVRKAVGDSLSELVVWDYTVAFYDTLPQITDNQEDRLGRYDYLALTDVEAARAGTDGLTRTECETLHLRDGTYVYWSVIVKHTDVRIETPHIALEDFECEVHGRDPRKKRTCLKCISKT